MLTAVPRPRLLAALLAASVLVGGGVGWGVSHLPDSSGPTTVARDEPVPPPVVTPVGLSAGRVPWDEPLALAVTNGTLEDVSGTDPDGKPLQGELTDSGWVSSAPTLLPASTYRLTALVRDGHGDRTTTRINARTALPSLTLHAVISPGDGKVVGVGMPLIVTLDRAVPEQDRAAVVERLHVTTTPAVDGAWRWMSPTELHYRGPSYWAKGTTITAAADLSRLHLSDGAWGEGARSTTYAIGSAVIATVDVTRHVMDVRVDGKLVRTVKVSTGRDKYPTKGGVHLVLEKTKLKVMDSATVGIPRKSPDGYYEKVPNSVRISYGGAFVHSADWSVRDQGVRNVSHGCVNISPADAAWFFDLVKRGDVVDIVHASAPPRLSDPGMSDWNVPFSEWAS